jgi:cellulose synthase/poly-beta-1,6-N-acetylglucosamine synthase-like glycosyltransferase
MLKVSIGIMAYNEEANIARLLDALLNQRMVHGILHEIVVVSSGSTDETELIVSKYTHSDSRIKLLVQKKREGKASAINLYLSVTDADICVLESADTIPQNDTIDKLIAPFMDASVGMTGGHPIPVNSPDSFIGFAVHMMWSLHHKIALTNPKLGELVAFRKCFNSIPADTAVDEASIEAIMREKGLLLRYVPEALVQNKGPESIRDFLRQRKRIAAGNAYLRVRYDYRVSTDNPCRIVRLLFQNHSWEIRETFWVFGVVALEVIGRIMGAYSFYVCKKNPFIWDISPSTKALD